ncbi:MAG: YjbH domain-containing protein [Micavibrio sp.]
MITRLPALAFLTCALLMPYQASAEPHRHASLMGPMGLTLMPTARMDETGTMNVTVGALDPYLHGTFGVQIAKPLYIGLRQTSEVSSIMESKDRLYPGIDVKLRLVEEGPYHPEITMGLQNAWGHKRLAGEYLVASKRFANWDVSAGMGWGRMGSAHQIGNPLGVFGKHFKEDRDIDGQNPNAPHDWFTGSDVGLFAGVEYTVPWVEGLSASAEWGADRYLPETASFDYNKPAPWALGLHYSPLSWLNMTAAWVGGEKILAALTFKNNIKSWPHALFKKDKEQKPVQAPDAGNATKWLSVPARLNTPQAIGYSLETEEETPAEQGVYDIRPTTHGLQGPLIRMNRRTADHTFKDHNGSPQEIWHDTIFNPDEAVEGQKPLLADYEAGLILDQQISLAEEDQGLIYRTSGLGYIKGYSAYGLMGGMGLRLNMSDNLDSLDQYRVRPDHPVRADIADYTNNIITLDHAYIGMARSLSPSWHMAAAAGYLEEMYGGIGGDILYRPFSSRWALGIEGWYVRKRAAGHYMNTSFKDDPRFTGHIKAYYEFEDQDMTAEARMGRYLDGDVGATVALTQRFAQGLALRGFTTVTNESDDDIFGGKTNLYGGLALTLPLGDVPYIPQNTSTRIKVAPFGREKGQTLENPIDIYAMSEPLSYRHIAHYWQDIVPLPPEEPEASKTESPKENGTP